MAQKDGLSFELTKEQQSALEALGGGSGVRLAGIIKGNKLLIDVVALNNGIVRVAESPFDVPGMAPFIACNGPLPTK